MPTIDMPNPTTPGEGSSSKEGFGTGIPTPLLLALIGGGIGLVVFLNKKSGTPSDSQNGTLLPNTAIMLGSLQQGILQLQGDVTTGNADLSSQLTGVGENLGSQIDAQSAMTQQAFSDLNGYLQTSFGTLQGNEDALSSAIAGLGTQNQSLAEGLQTALGNLYTISQQVAGVSGQVSAVYQQGGIISANLSSQIGGITAGLTSLGQQISGVSGQIQSGQGNVAQIQAGINSILSQQNTLQSKVNSIGGQIGSLGNVSFNVSGTTAPDFSFLNNQLIYSQPDATTYKVINGKLFDVGFWAGKQNPAVNTGNSLKAYSAGKTTYP